VSVDPAKLYREQADESRKEAAKSVSPVAKLRWRKLAKKWLFLAKEVANRARTNHRLRAYASLFPIFLVFGRRRNAAG
jgi:hypothetical protein